jgi:hypothetical protein
MKLVMEKTKESIEKALKERHDLSPEFRKVLENKLKAIENGVINKEL